MTLWYTPKRIIGEILQNMVKNLCKVCIITAMIVICLLTVDGRRELKFKAKNDQLVKEKLCIGNLSNQWTKTESEKTGLYRNIYDFAVDYEAIIGVGPIYDMHRFLMTKHNVSP